MENYENVWGKGVCVSGMLYFMFTVNFVKKRVCVFGMLSYHVKMMNQKVSICLV